MTDRQASPVWARCPGCGHCWEVCYTPMPLAQAAALMSQHANCPRCGTAGNVAKQHGGQLLEEDHS